MGRVKILQPENRLAKILDDDHGSTAEQLAAVADRRLEGLSSGLRSYVYEQSAHVVGFYSQGEESLFTNCLALSETAMNIAEVAGAADLPELGDVARGIRAMIDGLVVSGVWHTDALKVHIAALALLTGDMPPSTGEVKLMLQRLQQMRAAVGVVE